jgi:hypothetical protein
VSVKPRVVTVTDTDKFAEVIAGRALAERPTAASVGPRPTSVSATGCDKLALLAVTVIDDEQQKAD